MAVQDAQEDAPDEPAFSVSIVACSPDRTVFTEDDNDDGWISTDTTVEIRR